MAELYPSDAELNALSGTADSEQEVLYVTTGESPYYTSFYKMLQRLLKVSRRAGDLRVFKDGDLTFGVRAGRYYNGDVWVNYSQVTAQALTNNATNYIYLTAAGVLTVNTTGFPVPSVTPHIPLATIATSTGDYDGRDASEGGAITDYRGGGFLTVCGANTGGLNALDWQESVLDELDFTAAEPAAPTLGDRYLNTGTGASSETAQTVAANDIEEWNGTSWTEITPTEGAHVWIEDTDKHKLYVGGTWSVYIGTGLEQHTDGSIRIAATAAGDGLQGGAGSALAVDVSDFVGQGVEDDGTENIRVKLDGATIARSASGVKVADNGVAVGQLAAAVQDLMPNILLSGTDDGDGTGDCGIQVRDAANNDLAQRFLIRVWIADVEWSEPDPQTGFTVLGGGALMRTIEANADLEVLTDAIGAGLVDIDAGGAKTVYVMAEIDGRIYSSGAIVITVP